LLKKGLQKVKAKDKIGTGGPGKKVKVPFLKRVEEAKEPPMPARQVLASIDYPKAAASRFGKRKGSNASRVDSATKVAARADRGPADRKS
jgi:hypothetical protein